MSVDALEETTGPTRRYRHRRTIDRQRSSLGTTQLGIGLSVSGVILVVYAAIRFVGSVHHYPRPLLSVVAWLLLTAAIASTFLMLRRSAFHLSDRLFVALLIQLVVVAALDLASVWSRDAVGVYPTAAAAVGGVLLAIVTLRPVRDIAAATVVLGLMLVGSILTITRTQTATLGAELLFAAVAVVPPLIACAIVSQYRRIVRLELDRVMVASTVASVRDALGFFDSEELVTLDLEAEELFVGVADGSVDLPLSPELAARASRLATELRRHLMSEGKESWLEHAFQESSVLSDRATLRDPERLATYLATDQRDGLLSAVWLLLGEADAQSARAVLTLGPVDRSERPGRSGALVIPIVLEAVGVQRAKVDPAVWEALGRVGSSTDTYQKSRIRIEIDSTVDNPAEGQRKGERQ
ncbi:hypothetical protein SAMN06295974_3253 [Plantibacter flavus]|uniref:Uncharacterized protein n=1 Tax=Plantibacter flavus TaxID=150123 RepID=A0A3N2C4E4_9MICO|nr:hypothetical protein [Plantibacter flavus]ROR82359.1 hypothetical protein EDD42_2448 [Plantibacter flavus]SMG43447.1 hypothetical protein SAMN06295974_3253 [Plantibacter flavus]